MANKMQKMFFFGACVVLFEGVWSGCVWGCGCGCGVCVVGFDVWGCCFCVLCLFPLSLFYLKDQRVKN